MRTLSIFLALFLIPAGAGIAKQVPSYQIAKLLAIKAEPIKKSQFIGESFGEVHFMTSRPYRAILYSLTVELDGTRYDLSYEVKSRKRDLPQLRIGDVLEVRLSKNGENMFIRRAGGKDFETKILP